MPTLFFWRKYTFKDVYAYLLRLHYKTFHRLKYYFHAFGQSVNNSHLIQVPKFRTAIAKVV